MTPNQLEAYDAMMHDRDRWRKRAERLESLCPLDAAACSSSSLPNHRKTTMKKNEYRMWPNGPTIEIPEEYHWDAAAQEVVKNDLSWRGDLMAFWKLQHGK